MDKPGPRSESRRRPLIIERPDLAHPARRFLARCFTLLAWGLWIGLWLPVFGAVGMKYGIELPEFFRSSRMSMQALQQLLDVFPLAVGMVLVLLAVSGIGSKILRLVRGPKEHCVLGIEQLASGMALDVEKLKEWQSGRIVHVEHGSMGRVLNAQVIR